MNAVVPPKSGAAIMTAIKAGTSGRRIPHLYHTTRNRRRRCNAPSGLDQQSRQPSHARRLQAEPYKLK